MRFSTIRPLWVLFVLCSLYQVLAHPTAQKRFESAEHKAIGDQVIVSYLTGPVAGINFKFPVATSIIRAAVFLSFGDIVALAGDFYANWQTIGAQCQPQISDNYDANPAASIAIFQKVADGLAGDSSSVLPCILGVMQAQALAVQTAIASGQDPAQVYASQGFTYDGQYGYCTDGGYLWIAICNWDHFGADAVRAYKAGHQLALAAAKTARSSGLQTDLQKAYFYEAFAQHYLTDLFAPGHSREPRRLLHSGPLSETLNTTSVNATSVNATEKRDFVARDTFGGLDIDGVTSQSYPGDSCARAQHDEENANGLWMTNAAGNSWPSFGDKELFNSKSALNMAMAVKACQKGVDEIWLAFATNNGVPSPANYNALQYIPILDNLNTANNNFAPLFTYNAATSNQLFLRTPVDARYNTVSSRNVVAYTAISPPFVWQNIYSTVAASVSFQNTHPFYQGWTSPNQVVHVREGTGSTLLVNMYGGSGSDLDTNPWNMLSQTTLQITNQGSNLWTGMLSNIANDGIYILVGLTGPNLGTVRHLGIQTSTSDGSPSTIPATVLWDSLQPLGDTTFSGGTSVLGQLCQTQNNYDYGLIKYFNSGTAQRLEFWTVPNSLQSPPVFVKSFATGLVNHAIKVTTADFPGLYNSPEMYIATGYNPAAQTTFWYFVTGINGNTDAVLSINADSSANAPAQALLPQLIMFKGIPTLLRLRYGPSIPNQINVDFIAIQLLDPTHATADFVGTQTFKIPITPNPGLQDYYSWNLADVDGDGFLDIVAYIGDPTNQNFKTLVFPGSSSGLFSQPVASSLSFPTAKTSFWTASHLAPIITRPATMTYGSSQVNPGGFLQFFDNVGILGVRAAAPNSATGTQSESLIGQYPGISGQSSWGLGWSPVSVMGTGNVADMLGIQVVPLPSSPALLASNATLA